MLTVATYESAYRHMDQLGNRFGLLIVDEVHHWGDGLRDEALEMAIAGARLGLTATPPRHAATAIRLAELVGPTVFELAVSDLGFWTPDYVARKLALYRRARLTNLILCIDEDRNCAQADLPPGALVVRFHNRVDAAAVLRLIG
jgi:hypothetical protein